jgi:hypothetical protein
MIRLLIGLGAAIALLAPLGASAADSEELAELRQMLESMRTDYEQRILDLEQRLARAEQAQQDAGESSPTGEAIASQAIPEAVANPGAVSSGNAFNPQISVILNGNFYHDDVDGEGTEIVASALQPSIAAHSHDEHAHGGVSNGFNFSEAELAFSAAVDPYFDGSVYLAIDGEGNLDLEEAWFQTRSLPWGLKLRGGKFFSDFGYINNQHPHQWDFTDQNLAYLNLLGDHGLQDTGIQLTWLPDWPVYTLLGVEVLQGDQEQFGAFVEDGEYRASAGLSDRASGPRLWTAIVKLAPDLGYEHALQLGASYAHNRQHQELHALGLEVIDDPMEYGLEGDADLWGLDLVYKFDSDAPYGHHDFKLQTEYLRSIKNLNFSGRDSAQVGGSRKITTDGLYVQGLYGLAPRWQAAVRYDVLGLTNKVSGAEDMSFGSSDRWTAALTWVPTEFSTIRLQYEYSDILIEPGVRDAFNAFWLQILMSMGTHGAHRF